MDRIVSSSHDRTSLLSTHKVLRNTYFLLSLTLAFSAITATASTVLMLPSPGLILTLVGMYGLMFLTYKTANKPWTKKDTIDASLLNDKSLLLLCLRLGNLLLHLVRLSLHLLRGLE